MKKDRNTFFESQGNMQMGYNNMNNNGMYPPHMQANSSFNMGPMMPNNEGLKSIDNSFLSEIESKLAKYERSLARLEQRVEKLEAQTLYSSDTINKNDTNMYML